MLPATLLANADVISVISGGSACSSQPVVLFSCAKLLALWGQDVAAMNSGVEAHEGCHIYGWLDVKRVAANFHISVHVDDYMLLAQVG